MSLSLAGFLLCYILHCYVCASSIDFYYNHKLTYSSPSRYSLYKGNLDTDVVCSVYIYNILPCYDTVGWMTGRASCL